MSSPPALCERAGHFPAQCKLPAAVNSYILTGYEATQTMIDADEIEAKAEAAVEQIAR